MVNKRRAAQGVRGSHGKGGFAVGEKQTLGLPTAKSVLWKQDTENEVGLNMKSNTYYKYVVTYIQMEPAKMIHKSVLGSAQSFHSYEKPEFWKWTTNAVV